MVQMIQWELFLTEYLLSGTVQNALYAASLILYQSSKVHITLHFIDEKTEASMI